jgi:L-2-hydroxyglutarate oxidase
VLVNCAGLHSDRVARLAGAAPKASIVPFRGEYFVLKPQARRLVRNLIYPVPDPHLPFLGVHFTRTVSGEVECGPNAVLALAREGYRKRDVNVRDVLRCVTDLGFLRMATRHWRVGVSEIARSLSRRAFAKSLRRLVPALDASDLEPGPAGVRAQAVTRDGALVDDFLIEGDDRTVHVLNAPSPAATASLAIGERVAGEVLSRIDAASTAARA